MKIPKVLKIGGHYIAVQLVDKTDNNNCGEWEPYENRIQLSNKQPQSQLEVTLLHEIIHACNISIEDHALVESLSQQLYQVMVDNKLVFDGKEEAK